VLDSAGDVGQYTSITVGSDGFGLISYYDATNGDLKVAHCSNTFCSPYVRRR
jgi:cell shape-determining protein MreC